MASTIYAPVDIRTVETLHHRASAKPRSAADGASRSGIWVAIFAITMSFVALTSALFVREGSAGDWQHIALPSILYANTLVLLLSSLTVEMARPRLRPAASSQGGPPPLPWRGWSSRSRWDCCSSAGQYEAWRQLAAHGLFLATNPNSSFFYVFTGMHILHLLGGVAALVYLIGQLAGSYTAFRRIAFANTATYWHFMGILWLYLLLVLRAKI